MVGLVGLATLVPLVVASCGGRASARRSSSCSRSSRRSCSSRSSTASRRSPTRSWRGRCGSSPCVRVCRSSEMFSSRTRAGGRGSRMPTCRASVARGRLVVFDTLVEDGDHDAVRLVLAHELGHRRAGHILKGTALGVAGTCVVVRCSGRCSNGRGCSTRSTSAARGILVWCRLCCCSGRWLQLLGLPFGSAVSRRWEREADRIAVELTSDPGAFERMMRRLALANLADLDPPRYRLSHALQPSDAAGADRRSAELRPMTEPQWWELRPAQNLDAKTYRCPLCGEFLPSASVHVFLLPRGTGRSAGTRTPSAWRTRGGRGSCRAGRSGARRNRGGRGGSGSSGAGNAGPRLKPRRLLTSAGAGFRRTPLA